MEDSHEQDEMYVEVKSKRDVEVGDTVNIELKDSSLVIGSFIIYLIPLILFVVGYFIGARLSFLFGALSSEATGIISSFVFLYLSYLLTKRIDKRISQNKKFQSEIVNIISKNENI
jgi:positive regulator of sigma E activity